MPQARSGFKLYTGSPLKAGGRIVKTPRPISEFLKITHIPKQGPCNSFVISTYVNQGFLGSSILRNHHL